MTPAKWGVITMGGALIAIGVVVVENFVSEPTRQGGPGGSMAPKPLSTRRAAPQTGVAAQASGRSPRASVAEWLINRLLPLMQQDAQDYDAEEIARLRGELMGLGEGAAGPILARLASEADTTRKDLLLDLLRQVPGKAAERYLIREARSAPAGSTRSIAMDALAERGSHEAIEALAQIAATDPELPSRPLIVPDLRGLEDRSTELPDEVDYTPRMKAMVALASTEDDRAVATLLRILQREREESLRMRAAEHLGHWQNHQLVLPALRRAAVDDASRYVRLAALHALDGADDPTLGDLLRAISERDPDAGVRLLAQRLLGKLGPDPN